MRTATSQTSWIKTGLATLAAVAVLAIALPLLAALSIAARILIPFALLAVVIVVLMVPTLREKVAFGEEGAEDQYKGLRVPQEALLHSAHTWARSRGRVLVAGIDDLMARVLGPADAVELPPVGATFAAGEPMLQLRRGDRMIVARAPVAGRVVATNGRLARDPSLAARSPYHEGWAVRLEPTDNGATGGLLQGSEATRWFTHEVDRLLATMVGPVGATAVMHDGGAMVDSLHDALDDAAFDAVCEGFFGGTRS